jgi:di/tricarboxylate transporter
MRSRVNFPYRVYGLNHFSLLQSTDAGLIGAVYFATSLISAFVTNNAAAALMFPIAMGAAEGAGINVKLMSYAVMLGASDFSTPFGYQTNLMVYGPGGYKVRDCFLAPRLSFCSDH